MIVLVTDPRYDVDHLVACVRRVRDAVGDEDLVVQVRDKDSVARRDETFTAVAKTGARVVLNGAPEDALRLGAYGVHLAGERPDVVRAREALGDDAWISIAAHDDEAVERAVAGRATAALVSPIFETPGKGAPRGVDALSRARAIADGRVRIIALGGVDPRRAASCRAAGADGIAVIRAIFDASDPARAALEALDALEVGDSRLVRPLRP